MTTMHWQSAPDRAPGLSQRKDPNALVSIVAAFYNEEATIPAFFEAMETLAQTLSCSLELICVNDGSRDGTPTLLRAYAGRTAAMRVIDLSRNFGKEAAVTAGLTSARGEAAIVIDADLQDPPSLIPIFLDKWREGYDVIYGIRTCRRADGWLKRATAWCFYALFHSLTDTKLPVGAGDFRLMDRRAVAAFLAMPERNRFLKGLFSWIGFRQIGVEFVRGPRVAGRSTWSYLRLLNFAVDGITGFSIAPLRLASLAGGVVSLLGFSYAMFLIGKTIVWGVDVPGYASVMVVMMFLGGVQLLCLGLIGEYLGRLYLEAKSRPLYVVSDVYEETVPQHAQALDPDRGQGNLVPLRAPSEVRGP